jgi:hypothetical protein
MSWIKATKRLFQPSPLPSVTFGTTCWERDWRTILLDPDYLRLKQIKYHNFPFQEKLLIINNVTDLPTVKKAAQDKIDEGVLTRFIVADELEDKPLSQVGLTRKDFQASALHPTVTADWLYYNALGPLSAIYITKSDYLLYLTGDVYLEKRVSWIPKALRLMEKHSNYKVANLTWNENYKEAKRESHKNTKNFFISKIGFSDQLFLIKKNNFCRPIYQELRADTNHVPRGDVFEKRVLSYMKNQGWERITYKNGSYTHK